MSLTQEELAEVASAVATAEEATRGEIYCVVTEESGDYGETPLAWAAGAALLGPALLLAGGVHVSAPDLLGGWTAAQVGAAAERAARDALLGAILLQGALFLAVFALVSWRPVRRALTPGPFKRERVKRRAHEQFLAKNLHLTRERTGVLIYVSFAERMAELIADDGIAGHVEQSVWDQAMAALTTELRAGRPAAGLAAAVRQCGEVLARHFPPRPDDNPNELPDAVLVLPRT